MINFALAIPHHDPVTLHISDAGLLVIECLDLQRRNFNRPHLLVGYADAELRLVQTCVPQDTVYDSFGRSKFFLFGRLEVRLVGTLYIKGVVLECLDEEGLASRRLNPSLLVLKALVMHLRLLNIVAFEIFRFFPLLILVLVALFDLPLFLIE
jgi:hypothetical protein